MKSNKEFLEKGKRFNFHYYLIESLLKINYNFKIDNLSYFFQIEHINNKNDHDEIFPIERILSIGHIIYLDKNEENKEFINLKLVCFDYFANIH